MLFRKKGLTKAYYDFWLNRDEEHEKQHYFSKHFAFTHLRFAVYDRTVPKSWKYYIAKQNMCWFKKKTFVIHVLALAHILVTVLS